MIEKKRDQPLRILVVDDHQVVRRGLRGLLEDEMESVEVAEAEDVRSATSQLEAGSWDLVLLDINLPGRSGLELMRDAANLIKGTPVIVLTAFPEEEFALRALQLGAAAYLNKQRATDELLAAVRRVLAGGKYVTAALAERLVSALGGDILPAPHEALSSRELQILRLIALGRSQKEIATELTLSVKTVATYRSRIGEKMDLRTNVELTRYALHHGLVD